MSDPDIAIVYFNPAAIKHKKLKPIRESEIYESFNRKDLLIFTDSKGLKKYLNSISWQDKNILMMSSGNFNGIDLNKII